MLTVEGARKAEPQHGSEHAYFSGPRERAEVYRDQAPGPKARIYQAAPAGACEHAPGPAWCDYRSVHPVRVVRELDPDAERDAAE